MQEVYIPEVDVVHLLVLAPVPVQPVSDSRFGGEIARG